MTYGSILNFVTAVVLVAGGPFTELETHASKSEIWAEPDAALSLLQSRARAGNRAKYKPHARTIRGSTAKGTRYTIKTFVYGKYFTDCTKRDASRLDRVALDEALCQDAGTSRDSKPNTVHVWIPDGGKALRPVVVHTHGGGFISGAAWADPETPGFDPGFADSLLDNGIVLASVNYRRVSTTYQYEDSAGVVRNEEFVSVVENGTLTLDTQRELTDYKPVMGWQELMPKCVYDASRALDYLLVHAASLRIDPSRVAFNADSAGTALATYLSLVYPALPGHPFYRVVSLTLKNVQIVYPFLPLLSSGWALWADELGDDAPLSAVVSRESCPHVFGRIEDDGKSSDAYFACPRPDICNQSWSEEAAAMFCGDSYGSTTFGRLRQMLTWPLDSPQHRGLAKLWDVAANFKALRREDDDPLMVWIRTPGKDANDANTLIHSPLWAKAYSRVFKTIPRNIVQYVVYNGNEPGMPGQDGDADGADHYQSSFHWRSMVRRHTGISRESAMEMAMLHCTAMGLKFTA